MVHIEVLRGVVKDVERPGLRTYVEEFDRHPPVREKILAFIDHDGVVTDADAVYGPVEKVSSFFAPAVSFVLCVGFERDSRCQHHSLQSL